MHEGLAVPDVGERVIVAGQRSAPRNRGSTNDTCGSVPAAASARNCEKERDSGRYFAPHSARNGTSLQ
jgi:hypothetical protein